MVMGFKSKKGSSGADGESPAADSNSAGARVEGEIETQGAAEETRSGSDSDAMKQELEDYKDKYLRLLAEFENFKKRAIKERSELLKYQGERVFHDILEVADNLELAVQFSDSDSEKLRDGVRMIQKMFADILGRWDVRAESGVGLEFDPNKHQAISKAVSTDAKPGTITSELRKAYFYKDKLLRPGEVVVAIAPDESSPDASA